ncbi:hypothetical protein AQUCO_02600061v1 [Aquilegia coerulea]|uniref:S-adenosylmethionine decarboxylase proenzyme n=1 Tax=Aquilegia coerulea TaxID=218851 RepID=A0A2G5D812_AQUCA|nr:hypothetical protein AQUCO_02600061v1 [Aquilegia coerulea]
MAMSGFEGFEKRLEINFSGDDPMIGIGLRQLEFELLEEILDAVQCTVVSAMGNGFFDAYVLSESSLFVYPTKIIIKTCGTTQLLKSIPPLLVHAHHMGLHVSGCRYTRGSFIFPKAQSFPHSSFREEVMYLEENLPSNLCYRKACVMPSKKSKSSHSWHVYTASDEQYMVQHNPDMFTIEVCMTELDRILARKFFRRPGDIYSGDLSGKEMTALTGIGNINPAALVCDFGFDPCGYSMNSIDGAQYATIHVTPEDGYSYASFECIGSHYDTNILEILKKAVQVFRPATMSISITGATEDLYTRVRDIFQPLGLNCRSCIIDEFPSAGNVVFQTFTTRRKKAADI